MNKTSKLKGKKQKLKGKKISLNTVEYLHCANEICASL